MILEVAPVNYIVCGSLRTLTRALFASRVGRVSSLIRRQESHEIFRARTRPGSRHSLGGE